MWLAVRVSPCSSCSKPILANLISPHGHIHTATVSPPELYMDLYAGRPSSVCWKYQNMDISGPIRAKALACWARLHATWLSFAPLGLEEPAFFAAQPSLALAFPLPSFHAPSGIFSPSLSPLSPLSALLSPSLLSPSLLSLVHSFSSSSLGLPLAPQPSI